VQAAAVSRESGERIQPTAQAVGTNQMIKKAPQGRKKLKELRANETVIADFR
jgi:hypothetical protein